MCLSNIMFIELQVKEHQAALEKEAEHIRVLKSAKTEHRQIKRLFIEKLANFLISFGERLKRKYCPEASVQREKIVFYNI